MSKKRTPKLCYNSKVEFVGFDFQLVGIYLALRHEIEKIVVYKFVPNRIGKKGGKSTIKMFS